MYRNWWNFFMLKFIWRTSQTVRSIVEILLLCEFFAVFEINWYAQMILFTFNNGPFLNGVYYTQWYSLLLLHCSFTQIIWKTRTERTHARTNRTHKKEIVFSGYVCVWVCVFLWCCLQNENQFPFKIMCVRKMSECVAFIWLSSSNMNAWKIHIHSYISFEERAHDYWAVNLH